MRNPSGVHNIVAELNRRGLSQADVDKIMGGNFLRVFRANFG
jgi:membrane dipeptidase